MNNPSEIAREALRQLSLQRIPPTPDNYRALYFKIAGTKLDSTADTMPARLLSQLIATLPRRSLAEEKLAIQCTKALEEQQWPLLNTLLSGALGKAPGGDELRWDKLVGGLVEKWDTRLSGLTTAQKKAALDRVLVAKSSNEVLYEKLQGLLNQWGARSTADSNALTDEAAAAE
ncbi:MAG TPA: GGDEF domain-containing protein, partial [Rhodocyclaceae bacterium]|nr:GGDEF domain-containing protein [Rhodocyclaceae bacterium]